MPKSYSEEFRLRVVKYIESGHTQAEACAAFGISAQTASKWLRRYVETGELKDTPPKYKIKINPAKLRAYVTENPNATLRTIGETFGCSDATVLRWLTKLGISRKIELKIDPNLLRWYIQKHPNAYIKDISKAFGCSTTTIIRTLQKHNIPRKRPRKVNLDGLEAYARKHPKASHREVGEVFNCSRAVIQRAYTQFGIVRRKKERHGTAHKKKCNWLKPRRDFSGIGQECLPQQLRLIMRPEECRR